MDWTSSEVSAYRRYLGMKIQRELIQSLSLLLATSFRKASTISVVTSSMPLVTNLRVDGKPWR